MGAPAGWNAIFFARILAIFLLDSWELCPTVALSYKD